MFGDIRDYIYAGRNNYNLPEFIRHYQFDGSELTQKYNLKSEIKYINETHLCNTFEIFQITTRLDLEVVRMYNARANEFYNAYVKVLNEISKKYKYKCDLNELYDKCLNGDNFYNDDKQDLIKMLM